MMQNNYHSFPGALVSLAVGPQGHPRWLDGFWCHKQTCQRTLLIFVHGMYSNFYRSQLKKAFFQNASAYGCDVLSFNTRGAELEVVNERFEDCLEDIQAAIDFGRRNGYRRFILAGHSTGCQKIVFFQARRQCRDVKGLILLAPGDDYAIARREAGNRFAHLVQTARARVEAGRGDEVMRPKACLGFTARRYLSIADPARSEAKVFNYDGRLYHFRHVRAPMLLLFGSEEQYACLPVPEMHARLRAAHRSARFNDFIVPGADHSFHGVEAETARYALEWVASPAVRSSKRPAQSPSPSRRISRAPKS
jgi:pimeloyl-ACP methyl ester carboxylesterase